MGYCSPILLKARLEKSDVAHEELIAEAIDWATGEIEGHCHRKFAAFAQTRYFRRDAIDYDASGDERSRLGEFRKLYLDEDLLTVTTLTNGDGTVIPANGYWLSPRNETPYYAIELMTAYAWTWDTDTWVSVAGTWGFSETPSKLIEGACLRLAEWYYKSNKLIESVNPFSQSVTTRPGATYPAEVLNSLNRLVKHGR